jgi:Cu-processing system permease protein
VRAAWAIAANTLQEALRRRVLVVVGVLTVAFLGLYWLGVVQAFQAADDLDTSESPETIGVDGTVIVGATMLGLAMFAILFLGAVLAVFLTLGAVRGDAERGLLQPIVARPVGRAVFLLARFAAAAAVAAAYVIAVYAGAALITGLEGGWWPDRALAPPLLLAAAVVVITALALLGSIGLSATANGIAIFMLIGAGLVAGLLGQIGEAIDSGTLERISLIASWALPFEALYQSGLAALTADTSGLTDFVVSLGPFGGGQSGGLGLLAFCALYLATVGLIALAWFARRDLG